MKDKILADKVALVTGSRRGIGRATAIELARAGANVAVCDLIATDSTLELVEEEIRTMGVQSKKYALTFLKNDRSKVWSEKRWKRLVKSIFS